MSIDLLLDTETHDLVLTRSGDLVFAGGAERIRQQIKITLLAFLGEWFLDDGFGVPYLERVHIKVPQRAQLEAIFRARIRAVPGVKNVRSLDFRLDRQQRKLQVSFEAETSDGLVRLVING